MEMQGLPIRVLLIEDDEDDYILMRDLFSRIASTSYDVQWAATYEDAMKAAASSKHDVYLLDYRLGEHNGLEFLDEMSCKGCKVPVIVLTGQGSYEVDMVAMRSGAADYLVKAQINAPLLERSIRYAIERKRSEERLRASEKKYRRIVDTALEGIWIIDEEGKTTFVNQRMAHMLGYTTEEMLGCPFYHFIDDTRRIEAERHLKRLRQGSREQYDFRFLRRDGSDLWAIVNAGAILDEKGQFLDSLVMVTDITKRKSAEDELKASEEKMRLIIESSPIGIRICQRSRYVYVNPAFLSMFGYEDPAEIRGLSEELLFSPEEREMARRIEPDRPGGEALLLSYEAKGLKKNGDRFDIAVRTTRIDYHGEPAILDFIIDVNSEKALQAKLLRAQKIQAIGTLAGGIAHDFNNILCIILGFTELALSDAPKDSPLHRNLSYALEAIHRGSDLVNQILTFSRQNEQTHRPLHLGSITKETLKLMRASIPSTIEIRRKIDLTQDQDIILSDPTQIHQILMNLCTNSAHAMRQKGGILEVSLSGIHFEQGDITRPPDLNPGDYLKLSVSDTGHGMDSAIINRIFDPYFTTKEAGEGAGLGLGVVYGIVKSQGGGVTVYSEPGKGTTFNVYLPRWEGEVGLETEESMSLPTGTECVLFVDDEERLVDAGRQILELLGYRVVAKTSSTEAMEAFCAEPDRFDLVITDLTMPKKTGVELAKEILEIRPRMPIILCTGFSEIATAEEARATGIRELVMKPFVLRGLAKTVRRVLDENRQVGVNGDAER